MGSCGGVEGRGGVWCSRDRKHWQKVGTGLENSGRCWGRGGMQVRVQW